MFEIGIKEDLLKTLIVFCCVLAPVILFLSSCVHQDGTDWAAVTKYVKEHNAE